MSNYIANFKRYEQKYLISREQKEIFLRESRKYFKPDVNYKTLISNIYFDTSNYELIRKSIEKPLYKEKIRLRGYGNVTSQSQVYLELKKKFKGEVTKRRVGMSYDEAINFIISGKEPKNIKNKQILNELKWSIHRNSNLYPAIYLSYEREAFRGIEDENIRITFDTNILWRDKEVGLTRGNYGKLQLGDENYIMEIKVPSSMPMWLVEILSKLKIYPRSYSKIGVCYKENIVGKFNQNYVNAFENDKKADIGAFFKGGNNIA